METVPAGSETRRVELLHNISRTLNSFVGRESEQAQLQTLLLAEHHRLVTVTGIGGTGKTRLVMEVAGLVAESFKDGVWLVDLAPLADPQQLGQTVAQVLGLPEKRNKPALVDLNNYLKSKNLLLVLDNCEHLVEACARLADSLLRSCPDLCMLATSREKLAIDGETVIHLPPLSLPAPDLAFSPPELAQSEAVQLFVQRAQAVQPGFALDAENAGAVTQICQQLDGLPLALELAAAQMGGMGVVQLAARLNGRFRLSLSGNRLASPRQQTLQTLLDWSYNILTERERLVFRRLAVFNGSAPLEAVEVVCAGMYQLSSGGGTLEEVEILPLLLELVSKSLVQIEPNADEPGVVRYRLLATVQQYARQKLVESGESQMHLAYQSLLNWCLQLALVAQPGLEGPEQARWLQQLKKENHHFRTALHWALHLTDENQHSFFKQAVQLAVALLYYWQAYGYFLESAQWFLTILNHHSFEELPIELRSSLLHGAGAIFNSLDASQARALHLQSLKLHTEQENIAGQVKALTGLGWQAFYYLQNQEANQYALEALALSNLLRDPTVYNNALFLRAITAEKMGEYEVAAQAGRKCLEFWREARDRGSVASALNLLAEIAVRQQAFEQARQYLLESMDLQREIGSPTGLWISIKRTIQLMTERAATEANFTLSVATCQQFARWLGAIETAYAKLGGSPPPMTQHLFNDLVKAVSALIDNDGFATARVEGHQLSLVEALDEAKFLLLSLDEAASSGKEFGSASKVVEQSGHSSLTSRELEVLRLVAKGLTNPEVAEALSITPRTVNAHLTSIYSKLGLTSRSGAIRYALENKLA